MTEKFCASCGEPLVDGKAFCAGCGSPVTDALPPSAGVHEEPSSSKPKRPKWLWWAVGVGLLLAVASVGVGMTVMAQNRAAEQAAQEAAEERAARLGEMKTAFAAVVVVQSATEVGVNYNDYGSRVRDAAAAVSVYEPSDATGESVKSALADAMDNYRLASEVWGTKFEEYEALAFQDFKTSHPEILGLGLTSADDVLQHYWKEADAAVTRAKSIVSNYESTAD